MQQHDSKILPSDPTPTLGMGSVGQKSTFSGHGHVVYQIKGNCECGNKQAYILSFRTPSTPWVGSKVRNIFSESSHISYQINGNGT